jgi:formamidopyrimidine-DNA glycosylase
MPELPEVETTRRGIEVHAAGQRITQVLVRNGKLRQPVPPDLPAWAFNQNIHSLQRRGKYLLFQLDNGYLLCHLGMSGSWRVVDATAAVAKHDHIDIILASGAILRYHDPRRFGLLLRCDDPERHPLLAHLGPEPLSEAFSAAYLHQSAKGKRSAVKTFIMDSHVVVGVGNIYASESLFLAAIHPKRAAGRISLARYQSLTHSIQQVLSDAIAQGGTTLRDFVNGNGQPGYFAQSLRVYGRAGKPCKHCGKPIQQCVLGQRATYFCQHCQH